MISETTKNGEYRRIGHSLYKFDEKSNAYMHVYKDDRYNTLHELITAYKARDDRWETED